MVVYMLFVKQKRSNEWRISDWSSDVCSSDLWNAYGRFRVNIQATHLDVLHAAFGKRLSGAFASAGGAFRTNIGVILVFDLQDVGVQLYPFAIAEIGRASCRERVCQYV